jgi:hypothetical protein
VVTVWVPGGRVSEGQLMEIKEETIRDLGNLVVVAGWSRNWDGRWPGFHCITVEYWQYIVPRQRYCYSSSMILKIVFRQHLALSVWIYLKALQPKHYSSIEKYQAGAKEFMEIFALLNQPLACLACLRVGYGCFSQNDDFRSKYLEHTLHRHFYYNFNRKIVATLSSQLATDVSL